MTILLSHATSAKRRLHQAYCPVECAVSTEILVIITTLADTLFTLNKYLNGCTRGTLQLIDHRQIVPPMMTGLKHTQHQ